MWPSDASNRVQNDNIQEKLIEHTKNPKNVVSDDDGQIFFLERAVNK